MMKMQLNITLRYLIMNVLIIKERIYLNAKKRHNIVQENDRDDETMRRCVKLNRFLVFSFFRSRDSFSIKF